MSDTEIDLAYNVLSDYRRRHNGQAPDYFLIGPGRWYAIKREYNGLSGSVFISLDEEEIRLFGIDVKIVSGDASLLEAVGK